jgi:hypothetical protein
MSNIRKISEISEISDIYNVTRRRPETIEENPIKRRKDQSSSGENQSPDGAQDIENILNFVEKYRAELKKFSETITTRQDTTQILKLIEEKNIAPNLEPEWILNYALKIVEDREYEQHLKNKLQDPKIRQKPGTIDWDRDYKNNMILSDLVSALKPPSEQIQAVAGPDPEFFIPFIKDEFKTDHVKNKISECSLNPSNVFPLEWLDTTKIDEFNENEFVRQFKLQADTQSIRYNPLFEAAIKRASKPKKTDMSELDIAIPVTLGSRKNAFHGTEVLYLDGEWLSMGIGYSGGTGSFRERAINAFSETRFAHSVGLGDALYEGKLAAYTSDYLFDPIHYKNVPLDVLLFTRSIGTRIQEFFSLTISIQCKCEIVYGDSETNVRISTNTFEFDPKCVLYSTLARQAHPFQGLCEERGIPTRLNCTSALRYINPHISFDYYGFQDPKSAEIKIEEDPLQTIHELLTSPGNNTAEIYELLKERTDAAERKRNELRATTSDNTFSSQPDDDDFEIGLGGKKTKTKKHKTKRKSYKKTRKHKKTRKSYKKIYRKY